MAVYRLWVVGYPPRYVGQPPQEWLIRSRKAEMVGEWVSMALSRHERSRRKVDLNPLEMIEKVVSANDWPFDRTSDREIAVEVAGTLLLVGLVGAVAIAAQHRRLTGRPSTSASPPIEPLSRRISDLPARVEEAARGNISTPGSAGTRA